MITKIGGYSLGFLAGASGLLTVGGLILATVSAIRALVYKILQNFTTDDKKIQSYQTKITHAKTAGGIGLLISIPIVGGILLAHMILNPHSNQHAH